MRSRILLAMLSLVVAATWIHAEVPVVTNVVAVQDGTNKIVSISYDVFDNDGDTLKIRVEVSDDGGTTYLVPAFSFTGDIGSGISTGANKSITWDAGVDWDGEYSDQMKIKVIATDGQGLPGLEWGNEVPPGGFLLGQDGGAEGSGPSRHVNIPWSYWLSKHEIQNDEYCEFLNTALVSGEVYRNGVTSVSAYSNQYLGIPGGSVLINLGDVRDVRWNVNNFEVCEARSNFPVRVTWYGALAFAQHFGYDLPTEAEWEKAARGPDHENEGEHFVYPWGDTWDNGYANRYNSGDPWDGNSSYYRRTTPVGYYNGSQTPFGPVMTNSYSLYDMSGNVAEWTRSIYSVVESYPQDENLSSDIHSYTNASSTRVCRGGSWYSNIGTDNESVTDGSTRIRCHARVYRAKDKDYGGGYFDRPDLGFRVIRRDAP